MIDVIEIGADLRAQPAARHRMIGVAAEGHGPAVVHLGDDAAGIGTIVRAGTANAQQFHIARSLIGVGGETIVMLSDPPRAHVKGASEGTE